LNVGQVVPVRSISQFFQSLRGRLAATVLSGVLFFFSLRLTPLWPAPWLALIPLLLAAFNTSAREARLLAWLAVSAGVASNLTYYLKTTGPAATIILMILQVLLWGFIVGRTRATVMASRHWLAVFMLPVLMAGFDTLISNLSPHGSFGVLALTQADLLPVMQIASVLGAPAVDFLIGLFASVVAISVFRRGQILRPWLAYGLPVLVLAAAAGYGETRLHSATAAQSVRVGLAAVDDFIGPGVSAAKADAVWRAYEDSVTQLAAKGARIVVLPEKIAALAPAEVVERQRELSELARRNGVYLTAGMQLTEARRKRNILWLFTPAGAQAAEYDKMHMVPHLEGDLAPGHEFMVRQIEGWPYGLAICRDMLFAGFGREYSRRGVVALLVPAWDFYRDAWMASSMAELRGVEGGFAVVRAGRESYLNVSDRYGRVLARTRSDFLPGRTLFADLPLYAAEPTLYARTGDVFGWLCVAASVLGIVLRRQVRHT
jgi:apolipoprotein N-acyltransferase